MRTTSFLLVLLLALAGCSAPSTTPEATTSTDAATPTETVASPEPSVSTETPSENTQSDGDGTATGSVFPKPKSELPKRARNFAKQLVYLQETLPREVKLWRNRGGPWPRTSEGDDRPEGARDLMYGSLLQQRMFRELARRPWFERKVMRRVPRGIERVVLAHTRAARKLRSLVTPLEAPYRFNISRPDNPHLLRDLYRRAQRRYGVHWSVLASLNFVESKYGRFQGPSSAGAEGPMQFMPATWDAYGNGGNVWSPRDAIPAAARYLVASNYHENVARALWAYNHSWDYVHAVRLYARMMRKDPRRYPVYYFWQVFVITEDGDLQLTGPGERYRG